MISNCNFDHILYVVNQLISFSGDVTKTYGQLGARLLGIASYEAWTLVPCITEGLALKTDASLKSAGKCSGTLVS